MHNYHEIKTINNQSAPTKNQITNNKPNVIKNANVLQGYIANSMNGGFIKPIAYAPIMAGTKIYDYKLRANIKLLTPRVPVYQKLKLVLKTFFVPHKRVWKNAEKFIAQKGGMTTDKIKEMPNISGKTLSIYSTQTGDTSTKVFATDTDMWRDSWVSSYLPRYQSFTNTENYKYWPKTDALKLRGFKAIYNDFLRNKEFDKELIEYDTDTVSTAEYNSMFSPDLNTFKNIVIRGKRQNSYYTDFRTELLGRNTNSDMPLNSVEGQQLLNLTEWEKTVAELRSESENAQKNDWDIIAQIRGSKKLTQGKVQLLGEQTIGLNYTSVPQTTYNTNNEIQEQYQVLGQEGAYSYTEIDTSLFQFQEFEEEGYLHVIAQVTADSVFETGFERTGLNVGIFDIYRPDLIEQKEDVLYDIEKCGNNIGNVDALTRVTGFKRKFSEYFKLPNSISGDMTTNNYYSLGQNDEGVFNLEKDDNNNPIQYETQKAYTFFENNDTFAIDQESEIGIIPKNIWKDYTDLLINENNAIKQRVVRIKMGSNLTSTNEIVVKGQNQVFMLGQCTMVADLPINENIKNNYTKWGEK